MTARLILTLLHRYLGLAMALFLAMAGLTGAILAFHHEIDAWLNPAFYRAPAAGEPLGLVELVERAKRDHPALDIIYIESEPEPDHPALAVGEPRPDAATGELAELDYNWIYLDPVTGDTVATRYWARCCFAPEDFIPFLYEFHHSLTLPGLWGYILMGIVAILWTVDCFVGLFLTFPRGRPFLEKWRAAWRIKRGSAYRTNLDLHRAGGLWFWLLLLPIAVSSIAMNLPDQVFRPVVSLFSPVEPSIYHERSLMTPEERGAVTQTFAEIMARGEAEAARLGIDDEIHALYLGRLCTCFAVGYGDHHAAGLGMPWLYVDGRDGRLLQQVIPGEGTAGDIFMQLQFPIHGGRIAGLAGRIVICVTGLVIFMLSVTGIVIWWRKHRVRTSRSAKVSVVPLDRAQRRS
ncbi:MAG: PepSY-associated TM helix domain-containing protein [Alphaproteobacteria bacterium]